MRRHLTPQARKLPRRRLTGWALSEVDGDALAFPVAEARGLEAGGAAVLGRQLGLLFGGVTGGVPATGVGAVVLNITATQPTTPGYVTVHPTGAALPNASNLNFVAGQTTPNLTIARVGDGGKVSLYNFAGDTHLIADIVGWFPATSSPPPGPTP